jgi:hypothetical protein
MQFLLTILIGLGMGYLLSNPDPAGFVVLQAPPATSTEPRLFVDLDNVLLIKVLFSREKAPQITEVKALSHGRLTPNTRGESSMSILDEDGQVLYTIAFHVDFTVSGLGIQRETMERALVLPQFPEGTVLIVRTTQGEVKYELQDTE